MPFGISPENLIELGPAFVFLHLDNAFNDCLIQLDNHEDGILSDDNNIFGTYIHGIFDESHMLNHLLSWAGLNKAENFDHKAHQVTELNLFADVVEKAIPIEKVISLLKTHI